MTLLPIVDLEPAPYLPAGQQLISGQPTVMQWVNRLLAQIEDQERYARPFEQRYCNEYVLPFIAQEYREVYGSDVDQLMTTALDAPRSGTAAIGIDALVERLTVLGLTADDPAVAARLQQSWDENDLDVMHREATRETLIKSRAFAQVGRSTDNTRAVVGIDAPEQMAVERMQGPPYNVIVALKIQRDNWTGKRFGHLWLPGRDIKLVEGDRELEDPDGSGAVSKWYVPDGGETPSGLPVVPVVEFTSKARLLKAPISEIAPIATLVDIVDLIEGLMVFAGHFGAVPIRWATGLEVPRDPANPSKALLGPDGKPMIGFKPRADHFWANSAKDAKFGQLEPAGLASFVAWAEHASAKVRAKTSIASTYYSLDLKSHMSAELLKTDEAPMVRRVKGMGEKGSLNSSWRRVANLILMIEDPGALQRARPRARWEDPGTRVEAQATDSFQKVVASGLGLAAAAEQILGWDPELVARAVAEGEAARARAEAGVDEIDRLTNQLLGTGAGV